MRRRTYLGVVASGAGLLAGCQSNDGATTTSTPSPTTTRTNTETATDTPTETAVADLPQIDFAGLIWFSPGQTIEDIPARAIEAAGKGATPIVGTQAHMPVHDGELTAEGAVEIADAEGNAVETKSIEAREDSPTPNEITWKFYAGLESSNYSKGSYEGEVRLRDPHVEVAAEPYRFTFDIVDPFEPAEVSLVDYTPKRVTAGETVVWELTLRNESDRDSSIVSSVTASTTTSNATQQVGDLDRELPASETVVHRVGGMELPNARTYEFRLPAVDISWETEAT